jgi:hypothetical protein
MRRALAILTLALVTMVAGPTLSAAAQPLAGSIAQSAMPANPTPVPTAATLPAGCIGNSIQGPNCGVKPQASGDRGGAAQTALFFLVLAAMALIFVVIIRSTRARGRALSKP